MHSLKKGGSLCCSRCPVQEDNSPKPCQLGKFREDRFCSPSESCLSLIDTHSLTVRPLSMKKNMRNDSELSRSNAIWAFSLLLDILRTHLQQAGSSHRSGGLFLQQGLSPVEAPSGSMGKGKDGRVCQLPYSSFSQFFTGTEAQVWDLQSEQQGKGRAEDQELMPSASCRHKLSSVSRAQWQKGK